MDDWRQLWWIHHSKAAVKPPIPWVLLPPAQAPCRWSNILKFMCTYALWNTQHFPTDTLETEGRFLGDCLMNPRRSQTDKAPVSLYTLGFYFLLHFKLQFKKSLGEGCLCPMAHVWRAVVNFRTRFCSFHHVGSGEQTQMVCLPELG